MNTNYWPPRPKVGRSIRRSAVPILSFPMGVALVASLVIPGLSVVLPNAAHATPSNDVVPEMIASEDPSSSDAPSSQGDPTVIAFSQSTTTSFTSVPLSTVAFTPIDVAAEVASDSLELSGTAELLADGESIATTDVDADGTVQFTNVVVPFGRSELSVAYLGDDDGTYAPSESEGSPIDVQEVATMTTLEVSPSHARAGDPITFVATVDNLSGANVLEPRGIIEVLIDDEVVYTEVSSDEGGLIPGDGVTRFEVTLTDIPTGEQVAVASFASDPGFGESTSDSVDLRIDGVDTVLTPSSTELRGTPERPATASVEVETLPALASEAPVSMFASDGAAASATADATQTGLAVDGYVQAFLGDAPVGEPFLVADGKGSGPIAGLPLGAHEVELLFTPTTPGMFSSSAMVTVTMTASPTPGPSPSPEPAPAPDGTHVAPAGVLAATGGEGTHGLAIATLSLLAAAGLAFSLAKRRRV